MIFGAKVALAAMLTTFSVNSAWQSATGDCKDLIFRETLDDPLGSFNFDALKLLVCGLKDKDNMTTS